MKGKQNNNKTCLMQFTEQWNGIQKPVDLKKCNMMQQQQPRMHMPGSPAHAVGFPVYSSKLID